MKFLCVCHYGHSRSVALTRVLHARGHEAVAIGVGTSISAMDVLCQWADSVAILDGSFASFVPDWSKYKMTRVFEIGPDRWSNPYSQELLAILEAKAREFFDGIGD